MTTHPVSPSERALMEEDIRAVENAYDEAWRAGDIEGLLACLDNEAVLVNPYGQVARGTAEIRRELTQVIGALGHGSNHTSVISRIEFVTGDVAVVDGEALVQGAQDDGATGSFHHGFTDVLVRRSGKWLIAHIRAYRVYSQSDDDRIKTE